MIRINLLPVKAKQRQVTGITQLVVGIVLIVGLSLALTVHWAFMKGKEKRLTKANQELTKQIQNLDRIIGEVDKLDQKKAELNAKLDTIAQLNANKVGPVTLLEELSVLTPKKLWLSSLKEQTLSPTNHSITLTGDATSNETIAEFMQKLDESEYFQNVRLIKTTHGVRDNIEVQTFQLTSDLIFAPKGGAADSQASLGTGVQP